MLVRNVPRPFGQAVSKCEINRMGRLMLEFADQSTIHIDPDSRFQVRTFCGFEQVIMSTPGGRAAIFG
jgi:hypothetical protein